MEVVNSERGHILIVDDEESFLDSTAELFRAEGFLVSTASDSFAAAEILEEHAFDVVVSDINMPGNPNLDFVRQLTHHQRSPAVILVTAYPTLDTAIESVGLSIDAYLVKPVSFANLLETTERCIERKRAVRAITQHGAALEDWMGDLRSLRQTMDECSRESVLIGLERFVELTASNIGRCLADLMNVSGTLRSMKVNRPPCHMLSCPTLQTLTESLEETIQVLEKTKHSFKSKELGNLRKKLETIVDGLPRNVSGDL